MRIMKMRRFRKGETVKFNGKEISLVDIERKENTFYLVYEEDGIRKEMLLSAFTKIMKKEK